MSNEAQSALEVIEQEEKKLREAKIKNTMAQLGVERPLAGAIVYQYDRITELEEKVETLTYQVNDLINNEETEDE